MRIVTIAAIHQSFIDLVMERLSKSGLDVSVAGIAELRLRNLQKARLASGLMNAMATRTTYVCFSMCGALEIRMCRGVAPQAGVIDCLRRRESEPEDLFYIAAALYVLSAWSVAAFARNSFATMLHCKAGMRIPREFLVDLTVTGLTRF